jgi:hypothetical protein
MKGFGSATVPTPIEELFALANRILVTEFCINPISYFGIGVRLAAVQPPSTTSTVPVTNDDSSDAR